MTLRAEGAKLPKDRKMAIWVLTVEGPDHARDASSLQTLYCKLGYGTMKGRYLLSFDGFTGDVDQLDAVTKFLEERLALIRQYRNDRR